MSVISESSCDIFSDSSKQKHKILKNIRIRWENYLFEVLQEKKNKFVKNIDKNYGEEYLECKKKWSLDFMKKFCKEVEEYVHENTCMIESMEGIPIMTYKEKKVFSFENPEKHLFYNLKSYLRSINYIFSLLIFLPFDKIPILYKDLFFLTENELSSYSNHAVWLKQFFEKQKKSKDVFFEKKKESIGGIFSCPKCKSFQIEMEEKQTRSSDEPMTIFCRCEECDTTFIK
jgi:DNA-directed RNA polymerase subunit M/transcription elongation factor TFIIS